MPAFIELSWRQRRAQLYKIIMPYIQATSDTEEGVARALDVCGTSDIDKFRFTNKDLTFVGALESGQFGRIDVVDCRLNGQVYIRKTIEKVTAIRFRDQCFAQFERDLLLRAASSRTPWAPHLLCAFQSVDSLHMVMQYAEGGTLWDVLESAPDSRVSEADLNWWIPQAVCGIDWCHSQGFAHRDIKPHNLVLDSQGHLKLIDFGCAAPLLPPNPHTGAQYVAKPYCLIPCGTCDYISPEILQAHEDALFAAESGEAVEPGMDEPGYGRETDWWSLGAVMYELAYGVAPFFANDIQQTYARIVGHERLALRFPAVAGLSENGKDLISRFLTRPNDRIGRGGVHEIRQHPFFSGIGWVSLHLKHPPDTLLLPQFTYAQDAPGAGAPPIALVEEEFNAPFDYSHLFRSSPGLSRMSEQSHIPQQAGESRPDTQRDFVGFTWGPALDAFDRFTPPSSLHSTPRISSNFGIAGRFPSHLHPDHASTPGSLPRPKYDTRSSDPHPILRHQASSYATPVRPLMHNFQTTIPRTTQASGSSRRKRLVSDREALKQMLVCVGASARKKVMESGKKPRLSSWGRPPGPSSTKPRIPSLLINRRDGPLIEINTSFSADGSAPPSPSPRPGSSLSRRSGAASPFPFSQNTRSLVSDAPLSATTPSTGLFPGSQSGSMASRWDRDKYGGLTPGDNPRRPLTDKQKERRVTIVVPEAQLQSPAAPVVIKTKASPIRRPKQRTTARDIASVLETDYVNLIEDLSAIEKRLSDLKTLATSTTTRVR